MSEFDEIFDFVVVGSGAGSMCAALIMRAAGKSAVILEKTEAVGGTTARAGGVMWIPNNPFLRRDGIEDSYEMGITYLDDLIPDDPATPGASRERRRTYVRQAPRMIEFLLSQGIQLTRVNYWPDYYDERPGGLRNGRGVVAKLFDVNELGPWKQKLRLNWLRIPATHDEALAIRSFKQSWRGRLNLLRVGLRAALGKLMGKQWVTAGAALQGRMLQASLRAGVELRLNAPVKQLVVQDETVKGVVATIDGRSRRFGARLGVLANAGGFAKNQAMRDRFMPGTRADWSNCAPGDTGEMILEMMRIGAAVAQMEEMVGFQCTLPPGLKDDEIRSPMQATTAAPHAILVDQSGVRYQNEGGSYMAYCKAMLERDRTVAAAPSWAVLDSQFIGKYMLAGALTAPQRLQAWEKAGFLRKADTIEDLARQLAIEPAILKATVERFNAFVAKNKDDDFGRGERAYDRWLGDPRHRPSETLGTIETSPFYALPVYPGDVGTFGGVVTDEHARVLRADGSVIQGLYATATSTASVMGRVYPGSGASIGPGFVFGYLAARHAAGLDSVGPEASSLGVEGAEKAARSQR
jgi:3-oxosteroid 1-dehydrogenase